MNDNKDFNLTMECPRYSAALSDMYSSLPVCVVIIINPFKAWKKRAKKEFIFFL